MSGRLRRLRRAVLAATLVTPLLVAPEPARAQTPSASDVALAETLFNEGKKLMASGRHAEACPKLAESQRLDPGGGTLLNLASCHEAIGKTASAWVEYGEVVVLAQQKGRADIARTAKQRADALAPRLSRLVVEVPPDARVPGLEVKRDGAVLAPASFGVEMPLDPGPHTITASAAGRTPFSAEVTLGEKADRKVVTLPRLGELPPPVAAATSSAAPPPASASSPPPAPPSPPPPQPAPRTLAWIATSVGVVGLGTAVFFGLRSKSKEDLARETCPETSCRDPDAVAASRDGVRAATYANIAGAVGLAGAGVAVYLFLRDPSPSPTPASGRIVPSIGPGTAGVAAIGTF